MSSTEDVERVGVRAQRTCGEAEIKYGAKIEPQKKQGKLTSDTRS